MDRDTIENALTMLGQRMEIHNAPPLKLLACGGASLIAMEMVSRGTTKDIDIVARIGEGQKIESAKPFSAVFDEAIKEVAKMLTLEENWLNPGPTDLVDAGLPDGIMDRLAATREYGSRLTVLFIGRKDQICFKCFAAADMGVGRHVTDLQELKPTTEELVFAALWVREQDPSEGFKVVLKDMLRTLGYEEAARTI
jgi:hypothetical protein